MREINSNLTPMDFCKINNAPCSECEPVCDKKYKQDGYIGIDLVNKEKTNFDVITESIESLAQELSLTECDDYRDCEEECDNGCWFYREQMKINIEYLNQKAESEV